MIGETAEQLIELSGKLHGKRASLLSYWQELAEQFYPERADFTTSRDLGEDFASHLTSSFPALSRRELGDTFSPLLRPKDQDWFHLSLLHDDGPEGDQLEWLQMSTERQRRAMYDQKSGFVRSTKQADHDFATFGQAVLSVELARGRDRFLYRNWHLRDVAWRENDAADIDTVCRIWKPTATDLISLFPKTVHPEVKRKIGDQDPYCEINCLHVVLPTGGEGKFARFPFRSIYIDVENKHILEEVGSHSLIYVIPRWQTVSGSQYAHSPATVAALPDARLIQAITLTLLDAGEMYAAPPMIAVKNAIRSDIDLRARGITWVDDQYDFRSGQPLEPLRLNPGGYPIGVEIREETREAINDAFYLSKLRLPPAGNGEMTAYEVSQRVQEFIRTTLPLFEPLETDYNGALCEETFGLGMRNGLFGPLDAIPEGLQGEEIKFQFTSPLSEARDRANAGRFLEARNMLLAAAEVDPSAIQVMDIRHALRDGLRGTGASEEWIRDDDELAAMEQAEAEAMEQQKMMQGIDQAAQVATNVGNAAQSLNQSGLLA